MQEHIGLCPACQDLFTELNSRLGAILTPAALAAASSALGSAKRATILRASRAGHWRTWRPHPVTTAASAAAGAQSGSHGFTSVMAETPRRNAVSAAGLSSMCQSWW
jgi:hypothetical protein